MAFTFTDRGDKNTVPTGMSKLNITQKFKSITSFGLPCGSLEKKIVFLKIFYIGDRDLKNTNLMEFVLHLMFKFLVKEQVRGRIGYLCSKLSVVLHKVATWLDISLYQRILQFCFLFPFLVRFEFGCYRKR